MQTVLSRAVLAVLAVALTGCGGEEHPAASQSGASVTAERSDSPVSTPTTAPAQVCAQTSPLVEGRIRARLFVSPCSAEPADTLQVGVENRGGAVLTYGLPLLIQRRVTGRWQNAMKEVYGTREPGFRLPAIHVSPGETIADRRDRIRLPRSLRPGTYRVLKRMTHYDDDLAVVARATRSARFVVR